MTNIENYIELRKSGLRIVFVGTISLILAFVIYSRFTMVAGEHLVMLTSELKTLADVILAITFASMASITYGLVKIFEAEQQRWMRHSNSLLYYITNAFSENKYWKIMVIAAIAYGIFFGFLSRIFIYNNDVSFGQQGISIPSINIIPCCNIPGYVPMFSAYVTDHFLILVIPLNIILAVVVSGLVGFNTAIGVYAFKISTKFRSTKKISFIGSVGAAGGLFVGCPTCAGSFFSALLGFGVVGESISVLASFQTLFIALSIPVLVITPFLVARSIRTNCRTCNGAVKLKE
ncbi:MAG TPA: hypothetical protein VEL11_02630 [Candidatus Bathyarchaeia archaeon]|nr:hypothetical protein [Candidatus Bathyarchaeia archaeon]